VKLGAIAKDAVGNVVNEQPLAYFAGPFDIAAADDAGNVKLFGAGQVTAGAIYANSKTGFTTFIVKPATIKTVEIAPITTPLVVGSTVQLEPTTRILIVPFEARLTSDFTVIPISAGKTLLRVVQDGFPTDCVADEFYAGCERGWHETFAGIRRYLETVSAARI